MRRASASSGRAAAAAISARSASRAFARLTLSRWIGSPFFGVASLALTASLSASGFAASFSLPAGLAGTSVRAFASAFSLVSCFGFSAAFSLATVFGFDLANGFVRAGAFAFGRAAGFARAAGRDFAAALRFAFSFSRAFAACFFAMVVPWEAVGGGPKKAGNYSELGEGSGREFNAVRAPESCTYSARSASVAVPARTRSASAE